MYCQDTPAKAEIPMINVPGQRFNATHGIKIFLYIRSHLNISPFVSLYFNKFCYILVYYFLKGSPPPTVSRQRRASKSFFCECHDILFSLFSYIDFSIVQIPLFSLIHKCRFVLSTDSWLRTAQKQTTPQSQQTWPLLGSKGVTIDMTFTFGKNW